MGGRMRLAGAEVVGFSASEGGRWVGLGFRGTGWDGGSSGGGRPVRPEPVATTATLRKYSEKSTGPARMEGITDPKQELEMIG